MLVVTVALNCLLESACALVACVHVTVACVHVTVACVHVTVACVHVTVACVYSCCMQAFYDDVDDYNKLSRSFLHLHSTINPVDHHHYPFNASSTCVEATVE